MGDDFPDWTCGRTLPGRSAMPHATTSRTRPVKRSRKAGPGNYSPRGTSDAQLIAVLAYREKSHRLRRQHRKNHHHRPSFTGLIPTAPPRVTTKRHATPPTATPQNNPATTRSHPASRPHNTLGHAPRQTPAFPPRPNRVARQACPPIRQSGARSGHQPPSRSGNDLGPPLAKRQLFRLRAGVRRTTCAGEVAMSSKQPNSVKTQTTAAVKVRN